MFFVKAQIRVFFKIKWKENYFVQIVAGKRRSLSTDTHMTPIDVPEVPN